MVVACGLVDLTADERVLEEIQDTRVGLITDESQGLRGAHCDEADADGGKGHEDA